MSSFSTTAERHTKPFSWRRISYKVIRKSDKEIPASMVSDFFDSLLNHFTPLYFQHCPTQRLWGLHLWLKTRAAYITAGKVELCQPAEKIRVSKDGRVWLIYYD